MEIQFLGATQTVTGSKTLLTHLGQKITIDCGLFQGLKALRLQNREPLAPFAQNLKAILLTHAHLDHSGLLPAMWAQGFRVPIYASKATIELCKILLPDSGHLLEEEAEYANRHGFSKHNPALPLYTADDARAVLQLMRPIEFKRQISLGEDLAAIAYPAGHLLGAASFCVQSNQHSIGFSGDLGRPNDQILNCPEFGSRVDSLVLESTYGDRIHATEDALSSLAEIIKDIIKNQGTLLIPAFAVGRAQLIMFFLHRLQAEGRIPEIPVYLNSPMATAASEAYLKFPELMKIEPELLKSAFNKVTFVSDLEESRALNLDRSCKIVIAASGMATGGRVLHHLKTVLPDSRSTVLFVGHQALGTRGRNLIDGKNEVKIHGQIWPVKAKILRLDFLSAHSDQSELLSWFKALPNEPRRVFLNHGESNSAEALRAELNSRSNSQIEIPTQGALYNL